MSDSSVSRAGRKASKAPSKFPLFRHPRGWWCKKIAGKHHYFGRVADDPEGVRALEQYTRERADLEAGRVPRPKVEGLTVAVMCDQFLNAKRATLDAGEIKPRTWQDLFAVCKILVESFGRDRPVLDLRPEDFGRLRAALASKWGAVRLGVEIGRMKSVFRWASLQGLLDDASGTPRSVRFGTEFQKPPARVLRVARAEKGSRMFEPEDIRKILEAADTMMRAMVLLAVNGGFGNSDIGRLPMTAVDLKGGWLNFARPKTGISRRVPLWTETAEALQQVIAERAGRLRESGGDAEHLVFVTQRGQSWGKGKAGSDPVGMMFRRLLESLGLKKPGMSFYSLRHSFLSVAEETKDFPAVRALMGHSDTSVQAMYRERIGDDRLQAVVEHVRRWLFGPGVQSR